MEASWSRAVSSATYFGFVTTRIRLDNDSSLEEQQATFTLTWRARTKKGLATDERGLARMKIISCLEFVFHLCDPLLRGPTFATIAQDLTIKGLSLVAGGVSIFCIAGATVSTVLIGGGATGGNASQALRSLDALEKDPRPSGMVIGLEVHERW